MTDLTAFIENMALNAKENNPVIPGDYIKNGIWHCGKCHTPKECVQVFQGREFTVRCMCRCRKEEREAELQERKEREQADRISTMRSVGMQDRQFLNATFQNAYPSKKLDSLKRYCDSWEDMKKLNTGLILHGCTGTGKTYAAACIANELISRGVPALMTNMSRVLNELQSHYEGWNDYIRDLCRYPLLIIDDFGIERNTEYASEMVYNVIDTRYRSGLPLIITTNLTMDDLQNPKDITKSRIYDRVLEMCCIQFNFGDNGIRKSLAEKKKQEAIEAIAG